MSRAPATNVNHPRGAAWQDGELRASSIYDRYQEDFGGTEAGVLGHLLRNARRELAERLRGYGGRSTMTTTGR